MHRDWRDTLDDDLDGRFAKIVEVRRWLHAHPEASGAEHETSRYLGRLLADEGFLVRAGRDGRGVIADDDDRPADSNDLIALRADIDALRIHDAKQVEYRSRHAGLMHACGHDAHAALVYGTLTALRALSVARELPWLLRVRGVFQPAEETSEGAQQMVAAGAVDGVRAIFAAHVDPTLRVGQIGVRTGVLTANCDEMRVTVRGRGGHAARPHETSDPIAAAAQFINAVYLYIPRVTDSRDAVVVTIGQIAGGDNANVIPEEVALRGTIRTLDRSVRRQTMEQICRLAGGIGQTTETKIQVQFGLGSHSTCNDARLAELLRLAGREVVGADGVKEIPRPSMGSEDFAFYLDRVPGAMLRLGCASDKTGSAPLHTPLFDVDEEVLRIGAKILSRAAVYGSDPAQRPAAAAADPRPLAGEEGVTT